MVTARSGDFKRAFGAFLAFDITQVALERRGCDLACLGWQQGLLAGEVADDLGQ